MYIINVKTMDEISIIINGVRYDAVVTDHIYPCAVCDLEHMCTSHDICEGLGLKHICYCCFKESTKSFER